MPAVNHVEKGVKSVQSKHGQFGPKYSKNIELKCSVTNLYVIGSWIGRQCSVWGPVIVYRRVGCLNASSQPHWTFEQFWTNQNTCRIGQVLLNYIYKQSSNSYILELDVNVLFEAPLSCIGVVGCLNASSQPHWKGCENLSSQTSDDDGRKLSTTTAAQQELSNTI